jgi:hypothetical protein
MTLQEIGTAYLPEVELLILWFDEVAKPKLKEWTTWLKEKMAEWRKGFEEGTAGKSITEKIETMWNDLIKYLRDDLTPKIVEAGIDLGIALVKAIATGIVKAPYNIGVSLGEKIFDWWSSEATAKDWIGKWGNTAGGHIPNYASGNVSDFRSLIAAYMREKKMGPPGSSPVIANDSEYIIPSKSGGHVPNYQGGTGDLMAEAKLTNSLLSKLLMVWDAVPIALDRMGDKVDKTFKAILDQVKNQGGAAQRPRSFWYNPDIGFQHGGLVYGQAGADRVNARLTAGEYVMNESATSAMLPLLEALNNAITGNTYHDASSQTFNFGDAWSQSMMRDKVIPALVDAKKRGLMGRRW